MDILKHAGIDENLLIDMNDSGYTFDEIADRLDELAEFMIARIIYVNQIFQDNFLHLELRLVHYKL